jgi:GTPase SAR1 family protein
MPTRFSIVVVGDGAVGKSAMTLRFLRDQYVHIPPTSTCFIEW